jgi:hypothetical protein
VRGIDILTIFRRSSINGDKSARRLFIFKGVLAGNYSRDDSPGAQPHPKPGPCLGATPGSPKTEAGGEFKVASRNAVKISRKQAAAFDFRLLRF